MRNTRLQQKLPRVPMAKPGRVKQQACGSNARWEPSQEKSVEADCASNRDARVDLLGLNTCQSRQLSKLTTDRKAGCGKTARTVWREGRGQSLVPTPILDGGALHTLLQALRQHANMWFFNQRDVVPWDGYDRHFPSLQILPDRDRIAGILQAACFGAKQSEVSQVG